MVSKGFVSTEVWILSTGVIKWFIGQHTFQPSVSSCLEKPAVDHGTLFKLNTSGRNLGMKEHEKVRDEMEDVGGNESLFTSPCAVKETSG